jgi:Na+/proline symporter
MLGAFLLGVLTRRANQTGVMIGMGVSLVSMLVVKFFTPLAWTWYVLAGTVVCLTIGYTVSLMTKQPGDTRSFEEAAELRAAID